MSRKLYLNIQNFNQIYNSIYYEFENINNDYTNLLKTGTVKDKEHIIGKLLKDIAYSERENVENAILDKIHASLKSSILNTEDSQSGIKIDNFFNLLNKSYNKLKEIESVYIKNKELIPRTLDNIKHIAEIYSLKLRENPTYTILSNKKQFYYVHHELIEQYLIILTDNFMDISKQILQDNKLNYIALIILFIMFQIDFLTIHPFKEPTNSKISSDECNGRISRILLSVLFDHCFDNNILCNDDISVRELFLESVENLRNNTDNTVTMNKEEIKYMNEIIKLYIRGLEIQISSIQDMLVSSRNIIAGK